MVLAIVLITLSVANSALMLACARRILFAQKKQTEQVRFVLSYMVDVVGDLNGSVENALDCLVSADARLDEVQNPNESEAHVEC
jgi:hypothetical protein